MNITKNIISGVDFYAAVMQKIDRPSPKSPRDSESLESPVNKDRIYYNADVRVWDKNWKSRERKKPVVNIDHPARLNQISSRLMIASAIKIVDWKSNGMPNRLLQATYYRHNQKYYYLSYDFQHDDPVYCHHFFDPPGYTFDPIVEVDINGRAYQTLLQLSNQLVEKFPWVQSANFEAQLESGQFNAWHPAP